MYSLVITEADGYCEHCYTIDVTSVWLHRERQDGYKVLNDLEKARKKYNKCYEKTFKGYLKEKGLKNTHKNFRVAIETLDLQPFNQDLYLESLGFIKSEFEVI